MLTKAKQDSSVHNGDNSVTTNKLENEKKIENSENNENKESKLQSKNENKSEIKNKNKELKKIELNCIIVSISSMWSLTELAGILPYSHQSNIIGINFENNINDNSRFFEIRPSWQTSKDTINKTKQFIKSLKIINNNNYNKNINNMSFITVRDSPGLVKFRLLAVYINEAFLLLQENISSAKEIDAIMSESMSMQMDNNFGSNKQVLRNLGPLALADCIGLDKVMGILNVLHGDLGDIKYCPNFMLKQYVRSGRLGRKTKIGVYVYS